MATAVWYHGSHMAKPQHGNTVKIHYTGRLDDDSIFDTSRGRDPLEFTIGQGMVIPGFEEAVLQLEPGESITVNIPAEKAYGQRNEDMAATVTREQFPAHLTPEIGSQLQIPQPNGQSMIVTITDIQGDDITLDANHALAGKDLTFDIELVDVAALKTLDDDEDEDTEDDA